MRAPAGALAGSEALSPKAPSEGAAGLEIGALPGGVPRWSVAGSEIEALPEARLDQARWCLQAWLRAWIGIR